MVLYKRLKSVGNNILRRSRKLAIYMTNCGRTPPQSHATSISSLTLHDYSSALEKMSFKAAAAQFRSLLKDSEILTVESTGYEDTLRRWNAAIEKRAPIVVLAGSTHDVSTTIKLTKELGLELAVGGGGHFTGAASVTDSGVLLSLSRLSHVEIDAGKQQAIVGGGTITGAVTHAAAEHNLAVVAPNVSKVGFAGATLAGGYGSLTGQHGLLVDQLLSAEVVLADGTIVRTSPTEHSDLFWALRGAGPMFGVVTQLTVKLHRLHNGDNTVFAGSLWFPPTRGHEVIQAINRIVPDSTGRGNILLVMAAPPPTLARMLIASVFYDGTEQEAKEFFSALYTLGPQMVFASTMPYEKAVSLVDWTANLGQRQTMGSGIYQPPLGPETFDWINERHAEISEKGAKTGVSAELLIEFHQLGKVQAGKEGSAYPHRGTTQNIMVLTSHLHDADDVFAGEFVDGVVSFLRDRAGLSNGNGEASHDEDRDTGVYTGYDNNRTTVDAVFGPSRTARLREIKAKYDPDNIFKKWYPLDGTTDKTTRPADSDAAPPYTRFEAK